MGRSSSRPDDQDAERVDELVIRFPVLGREKIEGYVSSKLSDDAIGKHARLVELTARFQFTTEDSIQSLERYVKAELTDESIAKLLKVKTVPQLKQKFQSLTKAQLEKSILDGRSDTSIAELDERLKALKIRFPAVTLTKLRRCVKDQLSDGEIAKLNDEMHEVLGTNSTLSQNDLDNIENLSFNDDQIANTKAKNLDKSDEQLDSRSLSFHHPIKRERKEIRLLLLGKTGAGKSTTGNLILGRTAFVGSNRTNSCTRIITLEETTIDGVRVKVIDTPGFNDTSVPPDEILTEIAKVVDAYKDGIDGILFVYNLGNPRYTEEEKSAFMQIQEGVLGKEFVQNCFVILSHGDALKDESLDAYIMAEGKSDFGILATEIVNRHVIAVDNNADSPYMQKIQQEEIVRMVAEEVPTSCTPEIFQRFIDHQDDLLKKVSAELKPYMPDINKLVSAELYKMQRKDIECLKSNGDEKNKVVQRILNKITKDNKIVDGTRRGLLQKLIGEAVENNADRLVNPSFLNKALQKFADTLLSAAGQIRDIVWKKKEAQ